MTSKDPAGEKKESLIDFPAELSIKAMGLASEQFESLVGDLVRSHLAPGASMDVTTVPSSKGKYVSVRVRFVARDHAQLEAIYTDLQAHEKVLFAL